MKPAQSLSASHTGIERKKRNINKKAIPLMAAHYCWDCTFHHHLRVWFYCGWVLHLLTRSSCTPMLRASDNMMYWLLWKTQRSSKCLLIWFSKQASLGHRGGHMLELKGYVNFFSFWYLPPSQVPDMKIDTILSTNKEEPSRARPPLISLARILVVNGKC